MKRVPFFVGKICGSMCCGKSTEAITKTVLVNAP